MADELERSPAAVAVLAKADPSNSTTLAVIIGKPRARSGRYHQPSRGHSPRWLFHCRRFPPSTSPPRSRPPGGHRLPSVSREAPSTVAMPTNASGRKCISRFRMPIACAEQPLPKEGEAVPRAAVLYKPLVERTVEDRQPPPVGQERDVTERPCSMLWSGTPQEGRPAR